MEKFLFLIFIVLLCALPRICLDIVSGVSPSVNKDDDGKIVGGYNATIQQFPYQAFLSIYKGFQVFQCGGSVINSQHILTAAHCAIGASMIRARVGSTYANRGGAQYTSFFSTIHPLYNPMTSDYDAAVVRVLRRMALDGTNVRAVKLPPANTPVAPGTKFIVSGWGATMENGNSSPTLMAVEVPVIPSEECRKAYPITARMVCAGYPDGGKDSCQGDSGGPAVSPDGMQGGIVSFGKGCAQKGYPGVYTNVSSVREWIRQVSGA